MGGLATNLGGCWVVGTGRWGFPSQPPLSNHQTRAVQHRSYARINARTALWLKSWSLAKDDGI
eukprot:1120125-Alexandrium_andersonii.AAC.1